MRRIALPRKQARAVAGGLIILGAAQLAAIGWARRPPELAGPTRGQPLPDVGAVVIADGSPIAFRQLFTGQSCTLLVLISPGCAACRRMRDSWAARLRAWTDTIGAPMRAIWLTASDSATARAFTLGYDLSGIVLARAIDDPERVGRRLGVIGTPTSYLLDRTGTLRLGILGDTLPPAHMARAACTGSP
jgi:hypothetical protein